MAVDIFAHDPFPDDLFGSDDGEDDEEELACALCSCIIGDECLLGQRDYLITGDAVCATCAGTVDATDDDDDASDS